MSKTKNYKLDLVKPCGALELHTKKNIADNELSKKIAELGDISELTYNLDVIETLCHMVENVENIVLNGVQKKELVVKHLLRLYPFTNNDKDIKNYNSWIDYICKNKNIVKIPVQTIAKSLLKKSLSIVLKKE